MAQTTVSGKTGCVLLLLLLQSCLIQSAGFTKTYANCMTVTSSFGAYLHWTVNGASISMGVESTTPGGYFSLGFTDVAGTMDSSVSSTFADGWIFSSNDAAPSTDACSAASATGGCGGDIWMPDYNAPHWDAQQSLTDVVVSKTATTLYAEFTRTLAAPDSQDTLINITGVQYMMWATDPSNQATFGTITKHTRYGTFYPNFGVASSCGGTPPPATSTSTGTAAPPPSTSTGSTPPPTTVPITSTAPIDPVAFSATLGTNNDMTMYWEFDDSKQIAHFKMIAPTTGWISIAFSDGGSSPSWMTDCDCVVGWVDDTTKEATLIDAYSSNSVSQPPADTDQGGTSDYALSNSSQVSGTTIITFRRYYSTGDKWDAVLKSGSVNIVWAYADGDGDGADYPTHVGSGNCGATNVNFATGATSNLSSAEPFYSPGIIMCIVISILLFVFMVFRCVFRCVGWCRNRDLDNRSDMYHNDKLNDPEEDPETAKRDKYRSIPIPVHTLQGGQITPQGVNFADYGVAPEEQSQYENKNTRALPPPPPPKGGKPVPPPPSKRAPPPPRRPADPVDINLSVNGSRDMDSFMSTTIAAPMPALAQQNVRSDKLNRFIGFIQYRLPFTHIGIVHILVIVIYLVINIACLFAYKDKMKAFGSLVAGNALIATMPATRNSVLVVFTGIPFDKTIMYHRWIGRFVVAFTLIHSIWAVVKWQKTAVSIGDQFATMEMATGLVGTIVAVIMFGLSLEPIRRKLFELFFYTHFLFLVFFIMGALHNKLFIPFAIVAAVIYIFDRFFRFMWGIVPMRAISVKVKDSGDVVAIRFPRHLLASKLKMYKAGQYVFVNFPTVNFLEWHPYTLSSGPDEETGEITVKALGNHTKSLLNKAKDNQHIWIRVDGPYGNLNINYRRFPVVVMISGGIGFTPVLAMARDIYRTGDLMEHHKKYPPKHAIEHVYIIWTIQTFDQYDWFKNELQEIIASSLDPAKPRLHLVVYLSKMTEAALQEQIGFHEGRPQFEEFFDRLPQQHPNQSTSVFVCGPSVMVNTIWDLSMKKSLKGHRFDFHSETFDF